MHNFNNFRLKVDNFSTFLFVFLKVAIDPSISIIESLIGDLASPILLMVGDKLL